MTLQVWWDLGRLNWSMDRDSSLLAEKMVVLDQHSARLGADSPHVPTVWTDSNDNTVNTPGVGSRVLNGNMSATCQVWKWVGLLIIEGLSLLKDTIGMFGVNGTLPFRSKGPSVCWKGVLNWMSIKLLCR